MPKSCQTERRETLTLQCLTLRIRRALRRYRLQEQEPATGQSMPANDFQFVSGSRLLKPSAVKAPVSTYARIAWQLFCWFTISCKHRGPKAFYQLDKLKAHVMVGHGLETEFTCPVAGCFSARTPFVACNASGPFTQPRLLVM